MEEKLSKLSETVKDMQDEEISKDFSKMAEDPNRVKRVVEELYEKISNLEFEVLESNDNYYLEIYPFLNFDKTVVIKLSKGRTTCFEVGSFENGKQGLYLLGKYPLKLDAIGIDDNFVDAGELLYYCSKKAKGFPIVADAREQLNREIDEGYKAPQKSKATDNRGRMSLGGETLEEDVAFNEWMHKRFRG